MFTGGNHRKLQFVQQRGRTNGQHTTTGTTHSSPFPPATLVRPSILIGVNAVAPLQMIFLAEAMLTGYHLRMDSGQHLFRAVSWVLELLTGSAAIIAATIVIALFGFSMLSGRIDVRRGIGAVFGCFLVFGAASIAAGLMQFVAGRTALASADAAPPPVDVQARPPAYDPYAGAALGKQ